MFANGLIFRRIKTAAELRAVYELTYNLYLRQGFCWPTIERKLVHYPHLDNITETTVLVAIDGGVIVGTNSWTWDGTQGLHVDDDFKVEVDKIRRSGRALAASWRIVTDSAYHSNRKIVMGLIKKTTRDMVSAGVETALFSFNPQHERVYQKLLNMQTVAHATCTAVDGAPGVLMRLDREYVPKQFQPKE
jgi:hypothetical protein